MNIFTIRYGYRPHVFDANPLNVFYIDEPAIIFSILNPLFSEILMIKRFALLTVVFCLCIRIFCFNFALKIRLHPKNSYILKTNEQTRTTYCSFAA